MIRKGDMPSGKRNPGISVGSRRSPPIVWSTHGSIMAVRSSALNVTALNVVNMRTSQHNEQTLDSPPSREELDQVVNNGYPLRSTLVQTPL